MIKLYSRNKHRRQGAVRKPYNFTQHLRTRLYARNEYWDRRGRSGSSVGAGFTIIELLIATSIFSVVLMVALNGFFQIGKLYYKGVATSQTQATAQKVLDDMSSGLQFASGIVSPTLISGTTYYMCLGNTRYTYVLSHQVNPASDNKTDKFGLLRDYLPGSGCSNPVTGTAFNNPTELLGAKMRLSNLCLMPITGQNDDNAISTCTPIQCVSGAPGAPCFKDLWLINLKVAYGDDDILNGAASADPSCNSALSNSQYCSVANLQTVINRGYGN